SEPAQAALLRLGSVPASQRPRILATANPGESRTVEQQDGQPLESGRSGRLHPGLSTLLQRATLTRPALGHARHRIPALVRFLQRRIAFREGCGHVPELTDEALAILWRQSWAENAASLEAVLYALHLRGEWLGVPQTPCGPRDVAEALADAGLDLVRRLPSRQPEKSDLLAALWVTRTATQRLNKTRAALYLGWDPNTLAARLKDANVSALGDVMKGMRESGSAMAG
ncbi:MAG: hypothetical protein AAGG01_20965, partial [Planctomycetota bacterium]